VWERNHPASPAAGELVENAIDAEEKALVAMKTS
jgi:hypothetical protein